MRLWPVEKGSKVPGKKTTGYPVAVWLMGVPAASVTFYAYIVPFLISTVAGAVLAGVIVFALEKNGALSQMQNKL